MRVLIGSVREGRVPVVIERDDERAETAHRRLVRRQWYRTRAGRANECAKCHRQIARGAPIYAPVARLPAPVRSVRLCVECVEKNTRP